MRSILLVVAGLSIMGAAYLLLSREPEASSIESRVRRRGNLRSQGSLSGIQRPSILASCALMTYVVTGTLLSVAVVGLSATVVLSLHVRRSRTRSRDQMIEYWPMVLEDLRIRVGSLGQPLGPAFFEACALFPGPVRSKIDSIERTHLLSGSFRESIERLRTSFTDLGSGSVFDTLALCAETGAGEIPHHLEEQRAAREAQKQLVEESRAKLASVQLARYFIIIVPVAMGAVGVLLSGGHLAVSPSSLALAALAFAILIGCWWWSGSLMNVGAALASPRRTTRARDSGGH